MSVFSSLLMTIRDCDRSRAILQLELLALRHQRQILERSQGRRLRLTRFDRLRWVWFSRVWSQWRSALAIVKPETVISWHRRGFRLFWRWKCRHKTGRSAATREVRTLIHTMSAANPLWGAVVRKHSIWPLLTGLRWALCCILAAAWPIAGSASQRRPVEADQQTLIKLEQAWNDAFYRKDAKFIESILADDFIATYDDGNQGDKAKELALVADFNQQVESATQDEFTVRMYGDTAVVRFVLRLVGIKLGQRSELRLRFTDVWVMREGRWRCVSTHSTRIEAK